MKLRSSCNIRHITWFGSQQGMKAAKTQCEHPNFISNTCKWWLFWSKSVGLFGQGMSWTTKLPPDVRCLLQNLLISCASCFLSLFLNPNPTFCFALATSGELWPHASVSPAILRLAGSHITCAFTYTLVYTHTHTHTHRTAWYIFVYIVVCMYQSQCTSVLFCL